MNSYIPLATLTEEPALTEHLNVASADGHILTVQRSGGVLND